MLLNSLAVFSIGHIGLISFFLPYCFINFDFDLVVRFLLVQPPQFAACSALHYFVFKTNVVEFKSIARNFEENMRC